MVDLKSIGGCIATVYLGFINETIKNEITFIILTLVGLSTVAYNILNTYNKWKGKP